MKALLLRRCLTPIALLISLLAIIASVRSFRIYDKWTFPQGPAESALVISTYPDTLRLELSPLAEPTVMHFSERWVESAVWYSPHNVLGVQLDWGDGSADLFVPLTLVATVFGLPAVLAIFAARRRRLGVAASISRLGMVRNTLAAISLLAGLFLTGLLLRSYFWVDQVEIARPNLTLTLDQGLLMCDPGETSPSWGWQSRKILGRNIGASAPLNMSSVWFSAFGATGGRFGEEAHPSVFVPVSLPCAVAFLLPVTWLRRRLRSRKAQLPGFPVSSAGDA